MMNPYDTTHGWKTISFLIVTFFVAMIWGLWRQRPTLEERREFTTSINRVAATSLWKWNINSDK